MRSTASALYDNKPAVYYPIRLGNSIAYLILGADGYILVDTGATATKKKLTSFLRHHGILPNAIKLIVVTHVHYDHVRSLDEVKRLCDCPVAVGEAEAALLENGKVVVPPGANFTGRVSSSLLEILKVVTRPKLQPVKPEIVVAHDFSLSEFDINGWIIPTPGHSEGSISVVLATGEAFVGDLAVNYLPFNRGPIFPPFASDVRKVFKSWQTLLDSGTRVILPGHGKPFGSNKLREIMRKRHVWS